MTLLDAVSPYSVILNHVRAEQESLDGASGARGDPASSLGFVPAPQPPPFANATVRFEVESTFLLIASTQPALGQILHPEVHQILWEISAQDLRRLFRHLPPQAGVRFLTQ